MIKGFINSNNAGSIDTRKSIAGYVFTMLRTAISSKVLLQSVVALSTIKVDYIAVTEAVKEAIWMRGLLEELGVTQSKVVVYCDNQSAVHMPKHQVFHERSKHIDIILHFIRDVIEGGAVLVKKNRH